MIYQAELPVRNVNNIVRVVHVVQLEHIRTSRVQLSFDWPTPAVKCSNFGGNVKMHAKAVAIAVSVYRERAGKETNLCWLFENKF